MKLLGSKEIDSCNPVIGCTFEDCYFCYARNLNNRFHWIKDFSKPEVRLEALAKIHTKPGNAKTFFMNSMSDIADWSEEVIEIVFKELRKCPHNNYFFLTKRPNNLVGLDCSDMKNVWIGVSVTDVQDVWRIGFLKKYIRAANYSVQFEPLLGNVGKINLEGISQIIIGADSRKIVNKIVPKPEWVEGIVVQANKTNTPIWIKDSLLGVVGEKNLKQDKLPFLC